MNKFYKVFNYNTKKNAFTLAEILSVLIILGVVAAITIPTTLKRTTDRQNRTRLAKAVSAYDSLIQKVTIENNIVSADKLQKFAIYNQPVLPNEPQEPGDRPIRRNFPTQADYNNARLLYDQEVAQYEENYEQYENNLKAGECENIRRYIKTTSFYNNAENTHGRCVFRAGNIWWDMTNINNTIVAFRPETLMDENIIEIAKNYNDNRAFMLTNIRNETVGAWFTNDVNRANNLSDFVTRQKVWDYIKNEKNVKYVPCTNFQTTDCVNPDIATSSIRGHFVVDSNGNKYSSFVSNCDAKVQECDCEYSCSFQEGGALSRILGRRTGWDLVCTSEKDGCRAYNISGSYSPND